MPKQKQDVEQMFKEIAQVRKDLMNPETKEVYFGAKEKAEEIFRSDAFGNFLSLSKIYRMIDD